jgi:hypothetical protein
MSMRSASFATLLLCCGLALARPAEAQQITSPFRFIETTQSLGVFGGYLITSPGTPEVGPQSAPMIGIRYNLRFTGPLSGEAAISFSPSERQRLRDDTLVAGVNPVPTGETPAMNLVFAEAGLRFHLTGARTWRDLAPYVIASGGVAADLTGRTDEDLALPEPQRFRFGPSFALGVGVGTDWFVTERLSLRLEARNHILRLQVPAGLRPALQSENQWTNNLGLSLGTAIHF